MRGHVTQHDHMAADKKVGGVHMMDGQCRHGQLLPRDLQPPRHRQVQCQHSRHPHKLHRPCQAHDKKWKWILMCTHHMQGGRHLH